MISGKFNIVTDGQFGSCGKGLIASALAERYRPQILSTTNQANAGHTNVFSDESTFVAKALPSTAALNAWIPEYKPTVLVGPSAAFTLPTLLREIEFCDLHRCPTQLRIHPRAGVILAKHAEKESDATKHIASTMQGCGASLADKIMRGSDVKLARDYKELAAYVMDEFMPLELADKLQRGQTCLHEGAQGFGLDINHGLSYPYCTSRGTTAMQNIADMGVNHFMVGDVYLVIRPYPIRVGNVYEGGKIVGYSGDCYPDQHEISWQQVCEKSGAPQDIIEKELTTVTKRLRRVFTFSNEQLRQAALVNGATKIALNFTNYIDWSCFGCSDYRRLPSTVLRFIDQIEQYVGLPVTVVGTGPRIDQVCILG